MRCISFFVDVSVYLIAEPSAEELDLCLNVFVCFYKRLHFVFTGIIIIYTGC